MAKNKNTPDNQIKGKNVTGFDEIKSTDPKNTRVKKAAAKNEQENCSCDNIQDCSKTEYTSGDNNTAEASPAESLAAEKEKYLRLAAEYDNYRKRSVKEREMIYNDARTGVISKLLPVYDNLERALKNECTDESFYKGVEMIKTQLTETFNEMGVLEIPAVGEPFDPNLHNAVMSITDPNLGENTIAEEYQKGFLLGDRVIRFSTVVVAN